MGEKCGGAYHISLMARLMFKSDKMKNYENGDTVYVPFILEVDYKEYTDGTHYALCREHNSTELVFKDFETAKRVTDELHKAGYLGEYGIKKGIYNSGSYPCLEFGKNEIVYMSEYASKIDKIIESDKREKAEAEAKRIAENVKRFNEYPEIQEINLSNGNKIRLKKSQKSGQYWGGIWGGTYSNLVLEFNNHESWFINLFTSDGKINTRSSTYRKLLSDVNVPKEELNKILLEYKNKYNQISGLKLAD